MIDLTVMTTESRNLYQTVYHSQVNYNDLLMYLSLFDLKITNEVTNDMERLNSVQ